VKTAVTLYLFNKMGWSFVGCEYVCRWALLYKALKYSSKKGSGGKDRHAQVKNSRKRALQRVPPAKLIASS